MGVAKRLSEEHTGGLCVHTVQTGTSPEGTSFLQGLAGLTSCGTYRNASQISSNFEVQQLARAVFIGPGVFPVAAAGPCDGIVRLRGIEFGFDKADGRRVEQAASRRGNRAPERVPARSTSRSPATRTASAAAEYNNTLSYRRAEATKNYLVGQGVSASRLSAEGVGEAQPVASNDSEDGDAPRTGASRSVPATDHEPGFELRGRSRCGGGALFVSRAGSAAAIGAKTSCSAETPRSLWRPRQVSRPETRLANAADVTTGWSRVLERPSRRATSLTAGPVTVKSRRPAIPTLP